jgi:Tryptophan-associated transmembrane protein (Trp_oprn_chp)
VPGPPDREGSRPPEGTAAVVHTPTPAHRRSLQLVLVAVLAGVVLAVTGAGRPWARVGANVELPGIGSAPLGAVSVTGNDLAPLGALALLGLVLLVGVAVTRGRGRWAVGVALLALGGALAVQAVAGAAGIEAEAAARARSGELEGVPGGSGLRVSTSPAGPAVVVAGGLLLAAAGAEALRSGPRWPVLGDAFRAPPDRAQPAPDPAEPPWEGD